MTVATRPLVELSGATLVTPEGRSLFEELSLSLSRERVALIGRNGVGKSTLLRLLAGEVEPAAGRLRIAGKVHLVPQAPGRHGASSHGELRKRMLVEARDSGADVLLLDEPTDDLDEASVAWLRGWLREWPGCLLVASHDRRLLEDFRDFFLVRESGCRYFAGTLDELDVELERGHFESERRYARNLQRLAAHEEHTLHVARRKARKKRYGRCRELDRATPRNRLNQKRDHAQVSHGRLAQVREARLAALREWSLSTRRALDVSLAMELPTPALPPGDGRDLLVLREVGAVVGGRCLFRSLDLRLRRGGRLAVVGANGAGKTTLLEILLGRRAPTTGSVADDPARTGGIAQGATDWLLDESLADCLTVDGEPGSSEALARTLVAHKFPVALASRPLRSLSAGERVRAALICLFARTPAVELLILDEPTNSLDLLAQRALTQTLRAWPGGLVVASHDRGFLAAIGIEDTVTLGPSSSGVNVRRSA